MASVFMSYSHVDESLRDALETHLAALKRQGIISTWHDRRITAGSELGQKIDFHLNSAEVILLLVSPDFIASEYCYEKEMKRALERHDAGEARVIPIILRPCDWHGLLFGKLLAAPKEGKPITTWPNLDEAFLNVVTQIKVALKEMHAEASVEASPRAVAQKTASGAGLSDPVRSSNLRIKKAFTDLDRDTFRSEGFEYIAKFFQNSLAELTRRNPDIEQSFRQISSEQFVAALYRGGKKVCRGSARIGSDGMRSGGIEYSMTDEPNYRGMNEGLYVKADDQALYFETLGMQAYGRGREKLTFQGAAELFWELFIKPIQE